MANPQAENGHIDIANELGEAFFNLQLSGNQWRILWVIFRQTYGWHKKADRISISYFQRKTSLKRRHISRAIKDMVGRKIVTKNDTTFISTYGFQKDYSKWELSPKMTPITKNDTKTVTKIGVHKRNSKETILRDSEKPNPAVKEFLKYHGGLFRGKFGETFKPTFGREGAAIKRLLKTYSLEDLKKYDEIFFRMKDPFIEGSGYTLGILENQINKVVVEAKKEKSKW